MKNPLEKEELNLATIVSEYGDEDSARALLESLRWPNGAVCPHCGTDKPYSLTAKAGRNTPANAQTAQKSMSTIANRFSACSGAVSLAHFIIFQTNIFTATPMNFLSVGIQGI